MCSSRIQVEALSVPPRKNGPRGRVWNSLWGKNPSGLRRSAAPCRLTLPHTTLGKVSRKKVAVLLDYVQMRGGRALPKFFVHFSQTVYIGSIWGWGGRGRPLPKFFGTLTFKKSGTSCPNYGEGGVKVIWTKSKRTATFFRETGPKSDSFRSR